MAQTIPEVTLGPGTNTTLDNPDLASIEILLPDVGRTYPHFLAYEFDEHYLTPCAKFWFDLDQDELTQEDIAALVPGAKVVVKVNGLTQASGIVDEIQIRTGKAGTVMHVDGRDWLSPIVDSQVDPTLQFAPSMTVTQFLQTLLTPFGMTALLDDNVANIGVITGQTRSLRTSKTGKTSKSALAHQVQPYPNEHVLEFATRVLQRDGLWLRPGANPGDIIITVPNYDQDTAYQFCHRDSTQAVGATSGNQNNVLDGVVTFSRKDQPSILCAWASGGGGAFAHAGLRCAIINPFITVGSTNTVGANDEALLADVLSNATGPNLPLVTLAPVAHPSFRPLMTDVYARPLYKQDPESHTQAEIEAFARREMSLYMRRSLTVHYEFMGHTIGGVPIAVDTMAEVEDDRSGLHGSFWVLSRNFSKSAQSGTRTKVELIVPGSLQF